jgi:HEAT repeat protein
MIDGPGRDTAFLYELARESRTSELVAYLKRGNSPLIRRRAAELLGDLADASGDDADEEVVQALIGTVTGDDDDSVRARAIDALFRYGQESLERLVAEMGEFEGGEAGGRPTARAFEQWLESDYPEFRMVAASALGRIGDPQALPALVAVLTDSNVRVRTRAVRACGRIGDPRCVPALHDRLDDPDRAVRQAAVTALGSIGTREALSALVPVVRVDEEPLRRAAVEELGQFGSLEPVVVLLRAIADDTESVKRAAMFSLIQLFVEAPSGESQQVRETVAEQLSHAETGTVVPHLVDVLTESQRAPVRRNAAWLLGRVSDPEDEYRDEVYSALIDTLDAPDETTAGLAADSLAELGSDELERRLHVFLETDAATEAAAERAERVLEDIGGDLSREVVTNAVDYTYVREPADYTAQKRADDDGPES